jgi:hypothetical protein
LIFPSSTNIATVAAVKAFDDDPIANSVCSFTGAVPPSSLTP